MAVLCVDLIGSYITDQEDQEITWRPQDPAEVANASRAYDEWTARGYTPHLDHAWQILREFDPNVGRIVFGAPRYPMTGEQQEKIAVPIFEETFRRAFNVSGHEIRNVLKEAKSKGAIGRKRDEHGRWLVWQKPENFSRGELRPARRRRVKTRQTPLSRSL